MKNYDAVIIGAGSIGLACAWALSEKKLKVLVLEKKHSFGQGQNKAAIGGIRATHSQPSKITLCMESIKIFSSWQENYGDNIDWVRGGYLYPAYSAHTENTLKGLLQIQHENRLDISWIEPDEIKSLVPHLQSHHLRGGTFSPRDGRLSPLLAAQALYRQSRKQNAEFRFNEQVLRIEGENVITDKGTYGAKAVVLSTGASDSRDLLGIELNILKERHEAAITEPVGKFFDAMVVDIEERENAGSFYFYQNKEGQIIFCLSPEPPVIASTNDCSSSFLTSAARRLLRLLPNLANLKVRRSWCGFYPMTPDGVPFMDKLPDKEIYIAMGMCGQGLMLGPGIALNIAEMITDGKPLLEKNLMKELKICRSYRSEEALK